MRSSIQLEFGGEYLDTDDALAQAPKTTEESEAKSQFVLFPLPIGRSGAYLYGDKRRLELDEIDTRFASGKGEGFQKLDLYGLHTYGGYRGFFRPDLTEVIHLLVHTKVDLATTERVYVTTEPHPTDSIYGNFDNERDMHRAKTRAFIVPKAATNEEKKKGKRRTELELLTSDY